MKKLFHIQEITLKVYLGITLLLIVFFFQPVWSQNQNSFELKGTVLDNQGTLPGVTITVKDKNRGTVTDLNGKFSIRVQQNETLQFSFLGYKSIEQQITSDAEITIFMFEDITALKEVTVNAGYYTVKDKERTGSIARITNREIENQPVPNFLATMQGRMAGVEIIQDSGMPGGAFNIRIRGVNSLRADGNQPLYLIDGVPYSSETIGAIATSGTAPTLTSPLNSINPTDIESIEVLKDADATAIYGSRGANGVVLITTKKGKSEKTNVTINTSTAIARVTMNPKLMNTQQYLTMRFKAFENDGITDLPFFAYDVNGTWDQNRNTDWQKELIGGTAEIHTMQASVTGGNSQTQYLLSGNYRTESTVFPGDFLYRRGGAHFSMNHTSKDNKWKINFSSNYTSQNNNQPAVDLTRVARMLAPNAPQLFDEDGNLNWENSTWENPLAELESQFNSKIKDLSANAIISYYIKPNLYVKTSMGYNDLQSKESRTMPSTMYDPAFGLGSEVSSISINNTNRSSWIIEPQLHWNKVFDSSKIEVLIGSTFQSQTTNRLFLEGFGFSSNSLINDIASATLKTIDLSDEINYRYQAFFARVNYNWKGKYIFNITGRRDGSSRFGPGKKFANFGAIGAAWIFSNENLFKDNSFVTFGKLRMSWGITGNDQIGDYQYLDTYLSSGNLYQGVIGLQPTRLFNPAFGWESNKKWEIALEMGFLKDRIFITPAYYLNRSSSQLVGIPLPGTTGFNSLTANLDATVQNKGLELTFESHNIIKDNFKWSTSFNISANKNKLIDYPGLETSVFANQYVIGQPISIVKLYNFVGIDPETGIYQFEDVNGDGQITAVADRQTLVDLAPQFFGGLNNQLKYKNWNVDILFQFVKQEAFGATPGVPGLALNQLATVSNQENQQPYTTGANSAVNLAYSRYALSNGNIEDASFIRLKNVAISYDVPLKNSNGLNCQFILQGQNLLTFTKYSFGDPEFKFNNYLPPLRVISAGMKLNF